MDSEWWRAMDIDIYYYVNLLEDGAAADGDCIRRGHKRSEYVNMEILRLTS